MTSNSTVLSNSTITPSRFPAQAESAPRTGSVPEINELKELVRLVDGLPPEHRAVFYKTLDQLAAGLEHRQQMLGYVQDSLNQVSLDLKYLIFDLEATRRERDEYRRLAERGY
jgi:hypothetical protein